VTATRTGVTDPRQVIKSFALAYNARNLDGLLALYDPDAHVIAPWGERIEEPKQLRQMFARLLQFDGVMQAAQRLCVRHVDTALNEADWTLRRGVDPDGRLFQAAVRTYQVLRKGARGRWRVVIEHSATLAK
jgi:ketosteroid isomerase-like protein